MWEGCVLVRGKQIFIYDFTWNILCNKQLGKLKCRWKYNIKIDIKEAGCEDVNHAELIPHGVQLGLF
jgi:hypothetical protein